MPPLLLRTKRVPVPALARAGGECREGDLFILASDAVSCRLLNEHDHGPVDWARLEKIDPDEWEQEIHRLRDEDRIVNDDCTLVVVRIGAPPIEVAPLVASEPKASPVNSESQLDIV